MSNYKNIPNVTHGSEPYRMWVLLRWFLVPIVIITALNIICEEHYKAKPFLFDRVGVIARSHDINFMFLGDSIMGAGIDEKIFTRQIETACGKPVIALNIGNGEISIAEIYFAMRNILSDNPYRFNGCVCFIQAMQGVPDTSTWSDSWTSIDSPALIVRLINIKDLAFHWKSGVSLDEKINITGLWLINKVVRINDCGRIVDALFIRGSGLIGRFIHMNDKDSFGYKKVAESSATLGRLRIERSIKLAEDTNESMIKKYRTPIAIDWDETVISYLIKLLQSHNIKIIFLTIPVGPILREGYYYKNRGIQDDFISHAKIWKTPIIDTRIDICNEDLTDGWHIGKTKRKELTEKMAEEYIMSIKGR